MCEDVTSEPLKRAREAHKAGNMKAAERLYNSVLQLQPQNADANHNLGTIAASSGQFEKAQTFFKAALEANFNSAQFWYSYIDCMIKLEQFDTASALLTSACAKGASGDAFDQLQDRLDKATVQSFKNLIRTMPKSGETYHNFGNALAKQGKLSEAVNAYEESIKLKPNLTESYINLGIILKNQGKLSNALEAYQKAITLQPSFPEIYVNMGIVLHAQGEFTLAIKAYRKAVLLKPDYPAVYYNMAASLTEQRCISEAVEAYKRSIELKPDFVESYINMGNLLRDQGRADEAIKLYKSAIKINSSFWEAYRNIGVVLRDQGKLDEAILICQRGLQMWPENANLRSEIISLSKIMCDFSIENMLEQYREILGVCTDAVPPQSALSWEDSPERQLERSRRWSLEVCNENLLPPAPKPLIKPRRLKIGYLSADFKMHPVAYLISRVFELHDRNKFEILGYSISSVEKSGKRKSIIKSFDKFKDLNLLSDEDAANEIRKDKVDILIDLTGYTRFSRPNILSYRVAPMQVNYLGFPSSMGVNYIDYIVADPVVVPVESREYYRESFIYLPDSYQPTDDTREIAETATSRADFGLPDDAFVFCSFNSAFKISSREFDIWMRLLTKVKGSVLWLLFDNKWASENLFKEAAARGIDKSRIIFASRLSQAEHLARHKHADLFLDCFNYNAHTTASDALWAGLPVVTKKGEQFSARVAASVLTAIDLPELITETEEGYESLVLALATDVKLLSVIKLKLAKNRLKEPLFDTKKYTETFELALLKAYDLYFHDHALNDIWAEEII